MLCRIRGSGIWRVRLIKTGRKGEILGLIKRFSWRGCWISPKREHKLLEEPITMIRIVGDIRLEKGGLMP